MRLIFLGKPGAGKGTQARAIAEQYGIPAISTGDIVRDEKRRGTELGKTFQEYADKGNLVPDDLILDMVDSRLAQDDCKPGYLFDGFPRTLAQAQGFQARLADAGQSLDGVIELRVNDDVVVARLSGRRYAPKSGKTYHVEFSPPKVEGICDESGEALIQRPDDGEEEIRTRLAVYHEQTAPLVQFYEELGLLTVVDGDKAPADVAQALREAVAGLKAKKGLDE